MQILTSPKNDYIHAFVQDVNRGRVVSVGTIANGDQRRVMAQTLWQRHLWRSGPPSDRQS